MIMDLLSVAPAMRRSRPEEASRAGACAATCFTVTLPMSPVPTNPTWRGTCTMRCDGALESWSRWRYAAHRGQWRGTATCGV
jgi:hypothetical protein